MLPAQSDQRLSGDEEEYAEGDVGRRQTRMMVMDLTFNPEKVACPSNRSTWPCSAPFKRFKHSPARADLHSTLVAVRRSFPMRKA